MSVQENLNEENKNEIYYAERLSKQEAAYESEIATQKALIELGEAKAISKLVADKKQTELRVLEKSIKDFNSIVGYRAQSIDVLKRQSLKIIELYKERITKLVNDYNEKDIDLKEISLQYDELHHDIEVETLEKKKELEQERLAHGKRILNLRNKCKERNKTIIYQRITGIFIIFIIIKMLMSGCIGEWSWSKMLLETTNDICYLISFNLWITLGVAIFIPICILGVIKLNIKFI